MQEPNNEEQKQIDQAAWFTLLLIVVLFLAIMAGLIDKLVFDGQLFGVDGG